MCDANGAFEILIEITMLRRIPAMLLEREIEIQFVAIHSCDN